MGVLILGAPGHYVGHFPFLCWTLKPLFCEIQYIFKRYGRLF